MKAEYPLYQKAHAFRIKLQLKDNNMLEKLKQFPGRIQIAFIGDMMYYYTVNKNSDVNIIKWEEIEKS